MTGVLSKGEQYLFCLNQFPAKILYPAEVALGIKQGPVFHLEGRDGGEGEALIGP